MGTKEKQEMSRSQISSRLFEVLDEELKSFFLCVEKKYGIQSGSLWEEWITPENTEVKSVNPTTTTIHSEEKVKDLKKSNYQVFFSIQRNKIMKENPKLTFGEISKMVSVMWKQIPNEEKKKYVQDENDANHWEHLSIKELKKMCKDKQISCKNMKREDMIDALTKKVSPPPIVSTPIKPSPFPKEQIVLSLKPNAPQSRTKLEISVDEDKDEEDFFFEEEDDCSSDIEHSGNESDDIPDDCDDEDLFEEMDD